MYPIRFNRKSWCKPFIRPHECNGLCNIQYETDDGEVKVIYDAACIYPEKYEPVSVSFVENFEFNCDEIVEIPSKVKFRIDFPCRNPFEFEHDFETHSSSGIRLKQILNVFKDAYRKMYEEEEKISTKQNFTYQKKCTECVLDEIKLKELLNLSLRRASESHDDVCNICLDSLTISASTSPPVQLSRCGHRFHKDCISKWINTQKEVENELLEFDDEIALKRKNNSCPICRQAIFECHKCNNRLKYDTEYFGSVIPYDFENEGERNETDGPYGIYSLYFEDLLFKGIVFDKENNVISLLPFERLSPPMPSSS